jgi:hypothetical protein
MAISMSDDRFNSLKQDVDGTLIELVDKGYDVNVGSSKYHTNIIVTIRIKEVSGIRNQDIEPIKEYLHQLYDIIKYHKLILTKVDITPASFDNKRDVKLLDKKTGKVEDDIYNAENFESVWDSIDFCIFSSRSEPDKFYRIELLFS